MSKKSILFITFLMYLVLFIPEKDLLAQNKKSDVKNNAAKSKLNLYEIKLKEINNLSISYYNYENKKFIENLKVSDFLDDIKLNKQLYAGVYNISPTGMCPDNAYTVKITKSVITIDSDYELNSSSNPCQYAPIDGKIEIIDNYIMIDKIIWGKFVKKDQNGKIIFGLLKFYSEYDFINSVFATKSK